MTEMSEKDRAIMEALEAQREEQITTLRDGYRAVAKFHAQVYQANRQLLAEAWRESMEAWAHRDQVWEMYAILLGKEVEDLTDDELMKGVLQARPAWPWDQEKEAVADA